MTNIIKLPETGTLRVIGISFSTDVTKLAAKSLPLGLFCDFSSQDYYALGLIAHAKLQPEELSEVGALARAQLSNPFEFLRPSFNRIWEASDRKTEVSNLVTFYSHAFVCKELAVEKLKLGSDLMATKTSNHAEFEIKFRSMFVEQLYRHFNNFTQESSHPLMQLAA
jgi:hypothetical protein